MGGLLRKFSARRQQRSTSVLDKLIKERLLYIQEQRKTKRRSGKYSPSSFGRCYRLQYWNRKNEPQSNPTDIRGLIRMAEGIAHHKTLAEYIPEGQSEVMIQTDDVLGFADWVAEDCVYDFKTTDSWKFRKFWDIPTRNIIKHKKEAYLQVGWYALTLGKPKCCLVGVIQGSLTKNHMAFHYQDVSALRSGIMKELDTLKSIWAAERLPPAIPRAFNGNDCSYCQFKDTCDKIEGK